MEGRVRRMEGESVEGEGRGRIVDRPIEAMVICIKEGTLLFGHKENRRRTREG